MSKPNSHPVLYDEPSDDWADDAGDGPDGVGDPHEDGGVLRRDVQVVDGKARPGEATAAQGEGDAVCGGLDSQVQTKLFSLKGIFYIETSSMYSILHCQRGEGIFPQINNSYNFGQIFDEIRLKSLLNTTIST